jgi:hypothetical protein
MSNENRRKQVTRVTIGLVIALALGLSTAITEAAVGDQLVLPLPIPAGALCGADSGTAIAVVPGGKVGFPAIPILLVTSCQDKLFFIDPASPAAPVRTITTSVNPGAGGWKALSARADKGDLLACQGTNALYSIDYSPLTALADGTATLVRNGPAGSTCAGIAWDASDKTIYQTGVSGGANVVFKFAEGATAPATSVPAGCAAVDNVTGIVVAGTSLFVSCASPIIIIADEIRQGYKADGALARQIAVAAPANLAYDPVSFGSQFKDTLWLKGPAQLRAIEIPGGTSGQVLGAPVLFPAACPVGYPTNLDGSPLDADGDSLLDCWEDGAVWTDGLPGIRFDGIWPAGPAPYPIAGRDVTLCVESNGVPGIQAATECAGPLQKDVFVEIDYMQFHRPDPVAITNVVTAFANAPSPDVANPTFPGPIRLRVLIDQEIPHVTATAFPPCTPAAAAGNANFDTLKTQNFGTLAEQGVVNRINAKSFAYHYALFVHNQSGAGNTASGCSEVGGNDFMVSLGSWGLVTQVDGSRHNAGTTDQQAGTFMHELGHNFGLRHGGGDNTNCKPNYQSVMNYTLQTTNVITGRPLDYSRVLLAPLNEASLSETAGVGALPGSLFLGKVAFGPQSGVPSKAQVLTVNANGSIDWSRAGGISGSVARDVNNLAIAGCPAVAGAETLQGYNDWASIELNFRASVDFAGGATSTIEDKKEDGTLELTLDEALSLSRDIIDIKPGDPNNSLNRNSSQTVEVAMLSRLDDNGLLEFDARDLDPSTVVFHGTGGFTWALPVKIRNGKFHCNTRDANNDGVSDLVCQFDFSKNTLSAGETKAIIEGTTFNGLYNFHASDAIKVKP